jgi:SAM-dependent methyltransferase
VVSEYGASIWADPYLWIPEAARLLRPGGELVFLTNGLILELAWSVESERVGEALVYDYFGFHRLEDPTDGSITFQLPYGDWIRLFRANGLEVEDLIGLQPPEDADSGRWEFVTNEWARKWPAEEIWKARKRS